MDKIVSVERARLAPFIDRVSGSEIRDALRDAFDHAAGRYALGKIDVAEFRAITLELTRDASGTAAQQDRDAGAARTSGAGRSRWATRPSDGSGRMGHVLRIVTVAVVVLGILALMRAGSLASGMDGNGSVGSTDSSPAGRFATPRITLDMNDLPAADCWYEVTMTDADGASGGRKITHVETLCP